MFSITTSVKLSKKQSKIYLASQLMLSTIFVLFIFIFAKNFIFPKNIFYFDNNINSLANTISRPYETADGTSFHVSTYGEFDQITLSITLPENTPKIPSRTSSLIKKSYLAFLSPINTIKYTDHITKTFSDDDSFYIEKDQIIYPLISKNAFDSYLFKNNTADIKIATMPDKTLSRDVKGFAPATLISSKEGVFVIDGEKKHPIQDERTFQTLGYNFDNVIETSNEERAIHKKGRMITTSSTHPFGTLFHANDTNRTFIFDNDSLNKTKTTNIAIEHAITVQEASRDTASTCILKKSIFPQKYTCTAPLKEISQFNGNTYQITLKDMPNTEIESIQIELSTTISKKSFENRIESLRRKFTTIYN